MRWTRGGVGVASVGIHSEGDTIILFYRSQEHFGDWKNQVYPVRLDWTPCNYGGRETLVSLPLSKLWS